MEEHNYFVHPTAEIGPDCEIGPGTRIWHNAQINDKSIIGRECTIGKGAYIGGRAVIGDHVKIQNYANIFGAYIEDAAFIGPTCSLIEDPAPRSTNFDGSRKLQSDFQKLPVKVGFGASLGAGAIVTPGVVIGRFAMLSAGSVVTRDVPPYVLVIGNPARMIGYVCQCGLRLTEQLRCECGRNYTLQDHTLFEL